MMISSRTPEGQPFRCPVCGEDTELEASTVGDVCCPACGELLWWFRDRVDVRLSLQSRYTDYPLGSLDFVELVMQLEEDHGVKLNEAAAEDIQTFEDAIRTLRRQQQQRDQAG